MAALFCKKAYFDFLLLTAGAGSGAGGAGGAVGAAVAAAGAAVPSASGITIHRMMYSGRPNPPPKSRRANATRINTGSMLKYSARPAHTPAIILSFERRIRFSSIVFQQPPNKLDLRIISVHPTITRIEFESFTHARQTKEAAEWLPLLFEQF